MTVKSSNPERRAPGNPSLAEALAQQSESGPRGDRQLLLDALMSGPLLLAIDELPEAFDPASETGAPVRFVTSEAPGHGRVLSGFSSHAALAARAPAAVALSVDPASVLDWIVGCAAEGLLLDPEGAACFVSHDEARRLLGLPPRPGRGRRAPSWGEAPERAVREALERLLAEDAEASCALVSEQRTGKQLRFDRTPDGSLRLSLAGASLAPDERARAELLLGGLAGHAEDLEDPDAKPAPPDAADLQALFAGDVSGPARTALKVFTWVFGFSPGFELRVELE